MSVYLDYVNRESDLASAIDNEAVNNSYNKLRGWNKYYNKHSNFLNGLWGAIGNSKDVYLNAIKEKAFNSDGTPNNAGWGQWLKATIQDLPGGQDAINNWNGLSDSKKEEFIEASARRRMGYDWHNGVGGYGKPEGPGYPPGNSPERNNGKGLDTYSVADHEGIKNEITLNAAGDNYASNASKNNAYKTYGTYHWNNYGKNEARVLPGAKFKVEDGELKYESSLIGSGLKENFDNIVSSWNGSEANKGDYANLMRGMINGLPNKYKNDIITVKDGKNVLTSDGNIVGAFYTKEKLKPYDSLKEGAKPPMGTFDSAYYATQNTYGQAAMKEWKDKANNLLGYGLPDLDYTQRYKTFVTDSEGNQYPYAFLNSVYTEKKGDPSISDLDNRANAAEDTARADAVLETWNNLSKGEKKAYQESLLGLDKKGASGQYYVDFDSPYVRDEEGNIVYEEDADGNRVPKLNQANLSYLESSVFNVFGKKDLEQQDKFKALALDVLQESVDKLEEQRQRERQLGIFRGLPGFNEIYGANSSIANSLLGDSGIGGYLSMMGTNVDQIKEDLTKGLSGVTGISNNSSVYNWQKWFEESLLEKYENLDEIGGKLGADVEGLDPILNEDKWKTFKSEIEKADPEADPEAWNKLLEDNNLATGLTKDRALEIKNPENWKALLKKYDLADNLTKSQVLQKFRKENIDRIYTIEKAFKENFIEDYLKPRFDQSKSMDEFVSYLDTLDEDEQNVFQTQDALQSLKNVANAYAVAKLDAIKGQDGNTFDADFYFDPTTAINETYAGPKDEQYRAQKEAIAADWAAAKANPNAVIPGTKSEAYPQGFTWNQYAYYYGLDLNKKKDFARLHHDVVGYTKGYDAAKDITSNADIQSYITNTVLPKVGEAKLDLGDAAFSTFTTPEEFADHLLEGIDPTENNPEWKEILEQFGLDAESSLDEVKQYIIDVTRTGAAKDIRQAIKYLNERKLTPTQQRLGVTYIERPEDVKEIDPENQSALYQIFANAGYAGTEDEFFTEFMPDVNRGDMDLITAGLGGAENFQLSDISDDPFQALATVGSYFDDGGGGMFGDSPSVSSSSDDDDSYDYFNLFNDSDDYKSDAGRDYISEYATFFGG